jgi:hypothetical protein
MESLIANPQRIEELRCEIKALAEAVVTLDKAFAWEADHLRRYDQAQCLDDLSARLTQEIAEIQRAESVASYSFTKGRFVSGLAKALGASLGIVASHANENPLIIGARYAADEWKKSAPFGTVARAVGPKGIPGDVRVVSLSRVARETGKAEFEVRAALEGRGYRIMMPDEFLGSLGELKDKVLKGTATLPFIEARFSLKVLGPKVIEYKPKADCR